MAGYNRRGLSSYMSFMSWNFSFYSSLTFWLCAVLIAIGARMLGRSGIPKTLFLGLTSGLMLLALPGFNIANLVLITALSLVTYIIGLSLTRTTGSSSAMRRRLSVGLGICFVLAFLAFFKYPFAQGLFLAVARDDSGHPANLIRMIGVSYFSFRMIHFLIECHRRKIENPDLLTYIDYIIFFPAFISGPINRYNHFASQLRLPATPRLASDLRAGAERIVHGLFKKFVLAQILYPHVLSAQPEALSHSDFLGATLGLYAYALYFYFDFSGYTDLALGCARLIGIELPENFNNPFLKRNIRELWANWHMSLTSWLVDYIYWPIVRKFRGLEYFRRHPVLLSNLGMIITFIACGMWHGESANFVLWGAYHGLGIAVLTIYQREKRKARSPFLQKYFRSKLSTVLGTILTFNFFAFGLSLFVLDIRGIKVLADSILSRL